MAIRYLLDTNTASHIIKGNVPGVRERLLKAPMAEVGVSVITEAELRFGVAKHPGFPKLKLAVDEFLVRVAIPSWDSAAARHYAQLRSTLESHGEPMGNMDMMIAAQALALEATLVTSDRVFRRIRELTVEDWRKA
jgi:tRNA(fMet)-specific endonuclease VapC